MGYDLAAGNSNIGTSEGDFYQAGRTGEGEVPWWERIGMGMKRSRRIQNQESGSIYRPWYLNYSYCTDQRLKPAKKSLLPRLCLFLYPTASNGGPRPHPRASRHAWHVARWPLGFPLVHPSTPCPIDNLTYSRHLLSTQEHIIFTRQGPLSIVI